MPIFAHVGKKNMTTSAITDSRQTILYRFLTHPRYRMGRHAVLILVLIVPSFNQALSTYRDALQELGSWMYLVVLFYWCTYAFVVYFNLYYLLPRYLLCKRYLAYAWLLSVAMIVALTAQVIQEQLMWLHLSTFRLSQHLSIIGSVMDYLSSFLLDMLCMIGGTMTVLLKLWMVDNQRIKQLEKVHAQSEVAQLKEQVSPELLFKILNRSGQLAPAEGEKASKMLMKLSQLLRYQLYDCSREKVLLSAEINFLDQYLRLEKLYHSPSALLPFDRNSHLPQLNYMLTSGGDVNRCFVPPLLFIPFVQHALKQISQKGEDGTLVIHLEAQADEVVFSCSAPGVNLRMEDDLKQIRQRLELQYPNHYHLFINREMLRLELKGGKE